jgi:D-sedoheptulose 7-phosphate isomerase
MMTDFAALLGDLRRTVEASEALLPAIGVTAALLKERLSAGNKLLTCGNGGSAADALHMAEELVGRFDRERPSLPAVCLNADPTLMTCIGNDYGYDRLFSRQVEGLGRAGDVLVGFSTSGNSRNVNAAFTAARERGLVTIALLGKDGGAATALVDHALVVPSRNTARIQEIHTFILHAWLTHIEAE